MSTEQSANSQPAMPIVDESAPLAPRTPEDDANQNRTNATETTFIMVNCFVGAGILTVPFAFRLAGYSACILLMLVAALNWYTSLLLGKAIDKAAMLHPDIPYRSWGMGSLGRAAFGPSGDHFIRMVFGLELWFALETFLVLTGISVNLLTGLPMAPVIIAAGTLGCLSLSLPMKAISYTSFLAMACMVGGLVALIVCGAGRLWDHAPGLESSAERHHDFELARTPASFSIFLYCFSGLPCLPSIRAQMLRPTEDYPTAVNSAFVYSTLYYLAIGMLGYQFFANDTRRSFLKDLTPLPGEGHSNIYGYISAAAAGLFALKLQAGFPVYATPILEAAGLGVNQGAPMKHILLGRCVFCFVSVLFAVFARNQIDAVAELMGAFLTNTTSIIFPVAAYCKLTAGHGEKFGQGKSFGLIALLIFGVVYGAFGTAAAVHSILYGRSMQVGQAAAGYVSATAATGF